MQGAKTLIKTSVRLKIFRGNKFSKMPNDKAIGRKGLNGCRNDLFMICTGKGIRFLVNAHD